MLSPTSTETMVFSPLRYCIALVGVPDLSHSISGRYHYLQHDVKNKTRVPSEGMPVSALAGQQALLFVNGGVLLRTGN